MRSMLISAICLVGFFIYSWGGFSQTPQPSVQLTTIPAINQVKPFEAETIDSQSPVKFMLQALDAEGRPLENAKIHLQILTPPQNHWFTTDFPIVEGTTLLDMEALAPKGELQIQQMLPIRGAYKFQVDVTPTIPKAFQPIQQTLSLSVGENGVKFLNFGILAIILLIAGLGGGWIIGSGQPIRSGEIAPQPVRLLLSGLIVVSIAVLLFINISAEFAQSHMSMAMSHMTEEVPTSAHPAKLQSQGIDIQLSGDLNATVGQLAKFVVNVKDIKTQKPRTDVVLQVTTTQLENNWVAFAYEGIPDSTGHLTWQQQFFDGAPHQIEVKVRSQTNSTRQLQALQVGQTILVEGVAPPLSVRLISLTYFTAIVGVGLLLGLCFRRMRTRRIRSISFQ